jgi:hypothetical protein
MAKDKVGKMLRRFDAEDDRPRVEWEEFSETAREEHQRYACVYNADANLIRMNDDFPMFDEIYAHYAVKYPRLAEDTIRTVIRETYADAMQTRICMAENMADECGWDDGTLEKMLTPDVLTFACLGLMPEDHFIAPRLGGMNASS